MNQPATNASSPDKGKQSLNEGAEFDIRGTVQRVGRGPKATFYSLKCDTGARTMFVDVVFLYRPSLEIQPGDRVHISGNISAEKSQQKEIGKNGREYDKWYPRLIGEKIELLSAAQARIAGTGSRNEPANDNSFIKTEIDDDLPF